jgi:citrate synthase
MNATSTGFLPGLEGVVAAETRLSSVDGQAGELIVRGFPIEELALHASFEETIFLLWNDRLPNAKELLAFRNALATESHLPDATLQLLKAAAKTNCDSMDTLRMAIDSLSLANDDTGMRIDQMKADGLRLVACFPLIVATYWRLLTGKPVIEARPELGIAANYLYMLTGAEPSDAKVKGLSTYLNTVADHGLNASTFTARVITSTESDLISALTGALGALKGPLHGGAPGPALDMVFEIREQGDAEVYLRRKIEAGERFMGFGHRVYKVRDPRADVLAIAAREMYEAGGDMELFRLAGEVEALALRLLEEYKPGRNLKTNVEYYTALLLHGLDLPTALFTPTFSIGRAAGWTAHCLEQASQNRLIRPQSVYIGEHGRSWVSVEDR